MAWGLTIFSYRPGDPQAGVETGGSPAGRADWGAVQYGMFSSQSPPDREPPLTGDDCARGRGDPSPRRRGRPLPGLPPTGVPGASGIPSSSSSSGRGTTSTSPSAAAGAGCALDGAARSADLAFVEEHNYTKWKGWPGHPCAFFVAESYETLLVFGDDLAWPENAVAPNTPLPRR